MDEARRELSRYRLEKAGKCIHAAETNLAAEEYEAAVNRSYYAIFH